MNEETKNTMSEILDKIALINDQRLEESISSGRKYYETRKVTFKATLFNKQKSEEDLKLATETLRRDLHSKDALEEDYKLPTVSCGFEELPMDQAKEHLVQLETSQAFIDRLNSTLKYEKCYREEALSMLCTEAENRWGGKPKVCDVFVFKDGDFTITVAVTRTKTESGFNRVILGQVRKVTAYLYIPDFLEEQYNTAKRIKESQEHASHTSEYSTEGL